MMCRRRQLGPYLGLFHLVDVHHSKLGDKTARGFRQVVKAVLGQLIGQFFAVPDQRLHDGFIFS